jgi:hypothetical protein
MAPSGPGGDGRETAAHRAKEGASGSLPGIYINSRIHLLRRHTAQLDGLASEIRANHGRWITRSGILAAIIEAALQTAPLSEPEGTADEKIAE